VLAQPVEEPLKAPAVRKAEDVPLLRPPDDPLVAGIIEIFPFTLALESEDMGAPEEELP